MPLADGQVYAGYTIVRKLGEGGMGMVYLAQHPRLPRRDALKVLPAALTVDDEYRQRFNREADIAATLWHPHIVEVHDRGALEGRLWISMDYVDGIDANSMLKQRYPNGMPPDVVVRIIRATAPSIGNSSGNARMVSASSMARRMTRYCRDGSNAPNSLGVSPLSGVRPVMVSST